MQKERIDLAKEILNFNTFLLNSRHILNDDEFSKTFYVLGKLNQVAEKLINETHEMVGA